MKKTMIAIALLTLLAGPAVSQDSMSNPRRVIVNKLNNQKITVDFRQVGLEEALGFIRDFSGINIVVDPEVHSEISEEYLQITLKVKDLLLKSVLRLMLDTRGLTAIYKEGVLLIVPKGRAFTTVKTRIYDVRDMLFKIRDFRGPQVELTAPGSSNSPMPGATFILEEEPESTITEDFLVEMLQQNTGDGSWDENENANIVLHNGLLIVTQTQKVHREVYKLLQLLRQYQ